MTTTRKVSELLGGGERQEPELPANLETYVDLAQELAQARAQIKLLREALESAMQVLEDSRVHCTAPPDYAWSECPVCGGENECEPQCERGKAVVQARAALAQTATEAK